MYGLSFSHNDCYGRLQYESVVPKKIYPLRHGVSFVDLLCSFVHCGDQIGASYVTMHGITCCVSLPEVLNLMLKRREDIQET